MHVYTYIYIYTHIYIYIYNIWWESRDCCYSLRRSHDDGFLQSSFSSLFFMFDLHLLPQPPDCMFPGPQYYFYVSSPSFLLATHVPHAAPTVQHFIPLVGYLQTHPSWNDPNDLSCHTGVCKINTRYSRVPFFVSAPLLLRSVFDPIRAGVQRRAT